MKNLLLILAAMVALTGVAQDKLSGPTKIFLSDYKEAPALGKRHVRGVTHSVTSGIDYVNAFIYLTNISDTTSLAPLGVLIQEDFENSVTASVPATAIEQVASLDCVTWFSIAQEVRPAMDKAIVPTNVDKVHNGRNLPHKYHGNGVVVGVVDAGFDFNHPAMKNGAGITRIKYVFCANEGLGIGSAKLGKEYTTTSAINGLTTDYTGGTHGQHVVGIAAGTWINNIGGVADSADIAIGAMGETAWNNFIVNCAKKIKAYAQGQNKPCVINISYGGKGGPHDGTGDVARQLDEIAGDGCIILVAAGNEAGDDFCLQKSFTASSTSVATLLKSTKSDYSSTIEAWLRTASTKFKTQVFIYDTTTGKEVYQSNQYDDDETLPKSGVFGIGKDDGLSSYGSGTVKLAMSQSSQNKRYSMTISVNYTPSASRYKLGVRFTGASGQKLDVWATDGHTTFIDNNVSAYTKGNDAASISDMACGSNTLSIGSFNTRRNWKNLSGGTYSYYQTEGDISSFSSYGYDTKATPMSHPDVCAPGSAILSSINSYQDPAYNSNLVVAQQTSGSRTYKWAAMQGTSMATPFATGVVALWLEQKKDLNAAKVREIFDATAIRDSYTGSSKSVRWGAGKIDAWMGFEKLLNFYVYSSTGNLWYKVHQDETATVYGIYKPIATTDITSITINNITATRGGQSIAYTVSGLESGALSRAYSSLADITGNTPDANYDAAKIKTVTFNAPSCVVKMNDFANSSGAGVAPTTLYVGNSSSTAPEMAMPRYLATYNRNLTNVYLRSNIVELPYDAFFNCTSLAKITLPSKLRTIGNWAFQNTAIKELTLPASVTKIENNFLNGCKSLYKITSNIVDPTGVFPDIIFSSVTTNELYTNVRLYVPFGSEQLYHNNTDTKNIQHIIASAKLNDVIENGCLPESDGYAYHYKITDNNLVAQTALGNGMVYLRDTGTTLPFNERGSLDDYPAIDILSAKGYNYDRSRWIELAGVSNGGVIEGKRLATNNTFALTDNSENNLQLRFDPGYDVNTSGVAISEISTGASVNYDYNEYCTANFVEQDRFYFVNPIANEVATVKWAVYAGDDTFYQPERLKTADVTVNGYNIHGGFKIDRSLLDPSAPDFVVGNAYDFNAVLKFNTAATFSPLKGYEPDRTSLSTDWTVAPVGSYLRMYNDVVTGIADVAASAAEPVAVEYYNLAGARSDRPVKGVNIVVTRYSDGSWRSEKVVVN